MRNAEVERIASLLVGEWTLTMSDAWFLEPAGTEVHGTATVTWLGEAFLTVHAQLDGELTMVIGRADARDEWSVLYHDDRGVLRVFGMTWTDDGAWTMLREDPDFHQRFVAEVSADRIHGHWDASEDQGRTWKKDFDLTFVRARAAG